MVRWSALSICVRVASVGPLSGFSGGGRSARDPINLSPRNISQWDTGLCVLGRASRLRQRLIELTRRVSGLGPILFLWGVGGGGGG